LPERDTYSDTNAYYYSYSDGHAHCDADDYPGRDTTSYSDPAGSSHAAAAPLTFSVLTLNITR
jgi:hypothetical protein